MKELKNNNDPEYERILTKTKKYWNNVPAQQDKPQMKLCMVPLTVVCTKYDLFAKSYEPKLKKLFC